MKNLEIFIPLIVAAISFAFNVWNNIRELNYKKEELEERKIADKRKELAKKINEFYGPFIQNMKKSTTLYRALIQNRPNFRMLDSLLGDKHYALEDFDDNDRTLMSEIIKIGKQQQILIQEKGGLIDDPILTTKYIDKDVDSKIERGRLDLQNIGLLPRANAHYRILQLAWKGKLTSDPKRFEDYRFPRCMPQEVERRFFELQSELESLRMLKMKKKNNKEQLDKTIESYNIHANEYHENIKDLIPIRNIKKFIDLVPANSAILDLGCGSGRDSIIFKSNGLNVTGIDLSPELLKIAKNEAPDIDFQLMDIRKLCFNANSFNGVWASASILHIPKSEISTVLSDIYRLLKYSGIMYVSAKEGSGEEYMPDIRYSSEAYKFWTYYSLGELTSLIENTGFRILSSETNYSESNYSTNPWIEVLCEK